MQDNSSGYGDNLSEDEWQHSSVRSISTTSSLPVTRNMQELSIERDWDLLSSGSASLESSGDSAQQQNGSTFETDSKVGVITGPRHSTFDLSVLEDWRRVTGTITPMRQATESEAGVSEISAVSSNAFDPIFFPERNSTPTNKAPQRGCSTRHGILCQLCSEEIRGMRWMCKECPQWSVCTECFVITAEHEVHPVHTFIRVFSPADIFTIQGQPSAKMPIIGKGSDIITQPTIHLDIDCHNCKGSIIGHRFDCAFFTCHKAGISFCQDCEALPINCHPPDHPLIKYKLSKETSRILFNEDIEIPNNKSEVPKDAKIQFPKVIKRHMNKLSIATLPEEKDFDVNRNGGVTTSQRAKWMMEDLAKRAKTRKYEDIEDDKTQSPPTPLNEMKLDTGRSVSPIDMFDFWEADRPS